jgi:hypothetical protein
MNHGYPYKKYQRTYSGRGKTAAKGCREGHVEAEDHSKCVVAD